MNFRSIQITVPIALALSSFSSCSPVVMWMYGIKKPRVENKESLKRYLQKTDIAAENVYTLGFEDYQRILKMTDNKLPEVFIFDTSGRYIPYGDEWACNAGAFNFIEELNDTTEYRISTKLHRDSIAPDLRTLDGDLLSNITRDTAYHVYIFWAKFAGKLNKDHTRVWEEQALSNSNTEIRVYKVNMDFQEHWGEDVTNQLMN